MYSSGSMPVNADYERFSGSKIICQATSGMLNAIGDLGKAAEEYDAAEHTKLSDLFNVAKTSEQYMSEDQNGLIKTLDDGRDSLLQTVRDLFEKEYDSMKLFSSAIL